MISFGSEIASLIAWRAMSPKLRKACKVSEPNIHRIINANAGIKPDVDGLNAIALVRCRLRAQQTALDALKPSQWDRSNNPRRFHAISRWYRGLYHRKILAAGGNIKRKLPCSQS